MIFEFWMDSNDNNVLEDYAATSAKLRELLTRFEGFDGVERFESCSQPGKFVAVGFFEDEAAVARWRNHPAHRIAQELGRSRFFTNYRLRMAQVVRDYGPAARAEAPADSRHHHEGN